MASRPLHVSATALRDRLSRSRRVVVKIGSALLAGDRPKLYARLARDVAAFVGGRGHVVLVSSGAIALGLPVLSMQRRPKALHDLQAAAAAGQPELMRRWGVSLKRHGLGCAQVLLTHADLADRERFLNARWALSALLKRGVVPVVNENDSVATDEIRVGDNDQLSAHVATLIQADLLVILTSVDGLYSANPEVDPSAQRLSQVERVSDVVALAGAPGQDGLGVGGMGTKLLAAATAAERGIATIIACGDRPHPLTRVLHGDDVGTLFLAHAPVQGRKHWIGHTLKAQGQLHIDAGARAAIAGGGKSLLPSGLVAVTGEFSRGSMVEIVGPEGPVARGLTAYDSAALRLLQGKRSQDIAALLGHAGAPEIVHRDDMMLL